MKLRKVLAALFSAMLVFAFAACANGSSDSGGSSSPGDKPGAKTTEIAEIETTGTVSAATVVLTDDNETAKIAVDENSYYIFTVAEEKSTPSASQNVRAAAVDTTKGGTWKYFKNNKLVYEGTYKGDISELSNIVDAASGAASEGFKLELTVTAVADDSGDLYKVSTKEEDATFTFEIKPESEGASEFVFEATIPEIKASSTAVVATGVSLGNGPYIVRCGDYILFSGMTEEQLTWKDEKDEEGQSTKDFIIEIGGTIIDNEIILTLDVLKNIMSMPSLGVNYIVIYKNGMETALGEKEFAAFKEQLTLNTHYALDQDIFVILTDEGYLKAKTSGLLPGYGSSEGSGHSEEPADEEILTATPVSNGIKLTFKIPDGYDYFSFYRIKEGGNNPSCWYYYQQMDDETTGSLSVIDYFVEKDATYTYYVAYENLYTSSRKSSSRISAKASVTGFAYPSITNQPVGAFDSSSGKIKFTTKPVFSINANLLSELQASGFGSPVFNLFCCSTDDSYCYFNYNIDAEETSRYKINSDVFGKTFKYQALQAEFNKSTMNAFAGYVFEIEQNIQIPDFVLTKTEMITVNTSDYKATVDYINSEYDIYRGFKTFADSKLDGIVHITNTINPLNTQNNGVKTNGVMGCIFNLKRYMDNEDNVYIYSFSIAGFRYNQLTSKVEAYVETYKNVSAMDLEGSLAAYSHATGETWGNNDFGFELRNISPASGNLDIWIDVVANDGQTTGRNGEAGTYTVKFFSADPGRQNGENNAVTYTNTDVPALATLTIAATDVFNPYSSTLDSMKAPFGCYASVQGYQTLTGEWEFAF